LRAGGQNLRLRYNHAYGNRQQKNKTGTEHMKSTKKQKPQTGLKHHARRIIHLTPKFVHGMIAGAFVGVVVVFSLGVTHQAAALTVNSQRDCDDYAVIYCGALTTLEIQKRYSNDGVDDIYGHFGITGTDIDAIAKTAVAGVVHDDGTVTVGQTTVATNAVTAARKNINGSATVTSGSTTFYVRPVKVSFAQKAAPAYVVMEAGVFKYAIVASCGNPIIATPVPAIPIPTPPAPTTPTPTPPVVPQTPVAQPASSVTDLPNTGPGALIIIAVLSIIGGYVFHMTHRHVQKKKQIHKATHKPAHR
jgi:hypothetical protein